MKRFKSLSLYQKAVMLCMAAMVLVFTVLYPATASRRGFAYRNTILVPSQESGDTVYSGRVRGKQAVFTVSPDKTVVFRCGDATYGPYTCREDPSAIPGEYRGLGRAVTGLELRRGEELFFRGCVLRTDSGERWLFNEDGSVGTSVYSFTSDGSATIDANGNVIDPMEPTALDLAELMTGPELTHKGNWIGWFGGVFICALTAVLILFADELFRWRMSFRIRDAERAEPSDWEIMSRHIVWAALPVIALILFIIGLR